MEAASRAKGKKLAALPFERQRKRSRGPSRRLFGGAARSPRGGGLVGGGILERTLAKSDESLVVERDRTEIPEGLHGLRRLPVARNRVVVLFPDFSCRVLGPFL